MVVTAPCEDWETTWPQLANRTPFLHIDAATSARPHRGTGKSGAIYYLPAEKKLRISTYYPDTQYDVNKPYVFTVDSGHNVVHEQWSLSPAQQRTSRAGDAGISSPRLTGASQAALPAPIAHPQRAPATRRGASRPAPNPPQLIDLRQHTNSQQPASAAATLIPLNLLNPPKSWFRQSPQTAVQKTDRN